MKKKPDHYWNYRVLAHQEGEQVLFEITKVYYYDGIPSQYSEQGSTIIGDSIEEITEVLSYMKQALKKPILLGGEKFPQEFKPETK